MTNKMMIMLKKIRKGSIKIPVLIALVFMCSQVAAQVITPQQMLADVYKTYDSLNYLSFNVKYTYTSDTVNGDFVYDMLEGSYTLAGKKAKFNIGDIEFMQNDSFFITVYNNDKFILVADPRNVNAGKELPLRQTLDTLATVWQQYSTSVSYNDDTATVTLVKYDSAAQFLKFAVTYDTLQKVLYNIEYVFEEPVPIAETDTLAPAQQQQAMRIKRFKIEFFNYRFDNFSESVYDENQYIFFEEGACTPVDKYHDFRIFYSRTGKVL